MKKTMIFQGFLLDGEGLMWYTNSTCQKMGSFFVPKSVCTQGGNMLYRSKFYKEVPSLWQKQAQE